MRCPASPGFRSVARGAAAAVQSAGSQLVAPSAAPGLPVCALHPPVARFADSVALRPRGGLLHSGPVAALVALAVELDLPGVVPARPAEPSCAVALLVVCAVRLQPELVVWLAELHRRTAGFVALPQHALGLQLERAPVPAAPRPVIARLGSAPGLRVFRFPVVGAPIPLSVPPGVPSLGLPRRFVLLHELRFQ